MRIAIHQPNFMPWAGYFYKLREAELFVFLDDSQFTKNSFQNRVKIMTPQGPQWLTVPVRHSFGQVTRDVGIDNTRNWAAKHLGTIKANYGKARFFKEVYGELERVYEDFQWISLAEFNLRIIRCFMRYYGIETPTVCSSELDVVEQSTKRLIGIVKKLGGNEYLSGAGGDKYQESSQFMSCGVSLRYAAYSFKPYRQLWTSDFVSGLSILDCAMNCGRDGTIF